jgi:hypothetical protein
MVETSKVMWAGHVACIGEMRNSYKFWAENLKAREHLKGIGIAVWLILNWVLKK